MTSEAYDIENVREMARGRWQAIIPSISGVLPSYLTKKPGPCPLCGDGEDRFIFDDRDGNGTWYCRKLHGHGDGFEMVKHALSCTLDHAIRLVADHIGGSPIVPYNKPKAASKWKYAGPLSREQIAELESGRVLVWNPKKEDDKKYGGSTLRPSLVSIYRDIEKQAVGAVVRIEIDGKKITPTICSATDGLTTRLVMMAMPDPKPLLGSDLLSGEKPVLIVEGEKTWHAVRQKMPGWEVVTWGGSSTYKKADWEVLQELDCIIWPDADDPGRNAAAAIAGILRGHKCGVTIVKPPTGVSDGWDLADAFEEGWTAEDVAQYITDQRQAVQSAPSHMAVVSSWIDVKSNGKPLATIENFRIMMDCAGVRIKYNMISNKVEIFVPGASYIQDLADNASFADVRSIANRNQFPADCVRDFVLKSASENAYNPIDMWLRSRPWDGVDRITPFCSTLPVADTALRDMLVTRFLIGAVALAVTPTPLSMHGVLVLKGGQGIGKTTWVRRLLPPELAERYITTGKSIDPANKDSLFACLSRWIVELGEVGSTLRRADAERLKAFLTDDSDTLRRAYEAAERTTPRRTVFIASTNEDRFLRDDTGSRRYWVLDLTGKIDNSAQIDRQQLFAQALAMHEAGERHWIDGDDQQIVEEHNSQYRELDPTIDMMDSRLDWDSSSRRWITATELALEIGIDRPSAGQVRAVASRLRDGGCECRRTHGRTMFHAPFKKWNSDNF